MGRRYGFVGDTTRCPRQCQVQEIGPNGSSGADGTVSVLAHELTEAVTDPTLTGWFDATGMENGDKYDSFAPHPPFHHAFIALNRCPYGPLPYLTYVRTVLARNVNHLRRVLASMVHYPCLYGPYPKFSPCPYGAYQYFTHVRMVLPNTQPLPTHEDAPCHLGLLMGMCVDVAGVLGSLGMLGWPPTVHGTTCG